MVKIFFAPPPCYRTPLLPLWPLCLRLGRPFAWFAQLQTAFCSPSFTSFFHPRKQLACFPVLPLPCFIIKLRPSAITQMKRNQPNEAHKYPAERRECGCLMRTILALTRLVDNKCKSSIVRQRKNDGKKPSLGGKTEENKNKMLSKSNRFVQLSHRVSIGGCFSNISGWKFGVSVA